MKKSGRLATVSIIPLLVVVGLSSVVWAGAIMSSRYGSHDPAASTYTYSDNGLSCTIATGSVPASVATLVESVVQNQKFLEIAGTSPYVFGNAQDITDRSLTTGGIVLGGPAQNGSIIGGTTVPLPNLLEMVFYSYGSATNCGDTSVRYGSTSQVQTIVVQIPIEPGGFNMTGATYHFSQGNWS